MISKFRQYHTYEWLDSKGKPTSTIVCWFVDDTTDRELLMRYRHSEKCSACAAERLNKK